MKKFRIRDRSKTIHYVHSLNNKQVDLTEEHLLSVLGPSGCGNTTLLRSIAGFETPDTGVIEIDGERVFDSSTNKKAEKRRIGYVPQEGALFPHLSVAQNISFGLSRKERRSY